MPEKKDGFVVTDKRKFTSEGEVRPDAPAAETPAPPAAEPAAPPQPEAKTSFAEPEPEVKHIPASAEELSADAPPPPSEAQQKEAQDAYARASREIDARLAADLGGPRPQEFQVTFDKFITSLYMNAMFQLGFIHEEGRQPRVDLLAARQTIDTLELLAQKTRGNLAPDESKFLEERLYELRVAYLDMLNAVVRAAQQAPPPPPGEKK
jgi:hypothetical protein